jgi:DNA-binding CsgD family transcriptional regulator
MPVSKIALENNLVQLCNVFLQDLADPLSIIDREYHIFWANRRKAGEHNLSQKDIIGKVCYEIFFGKNKPCSQCLVSQVKITGQPCSIEKICDLPEGRQVWCQQRAVPLCDTSNKTVYILIWGIHIKEKIILKQRRDKQIRGLKKAIFELKQLKKLSPNEIDYRNNHFRLTGREVEVLRLMAEGQTNPEISQALSISAHTAKSHVINIFNKLGVDNRTQAAVLAAFHQLVIPLKN